MSNTSKYATVIAILLFMLTSCKKKDTQEPTQPHPAYTFQISANINGTQYVQTGCYYFERFSFLSINYDSTASDTYPRISIQVINTFDTGTYDLEWAGAYANVIRTPQTTVTDAYGTLVVTTRTDSVIIGTFNFTCTDSAKVTNGSFTAKKIF